MGDETEYLKLSIEDRCQHKLWKARVSGYEDAGKLFSTLTDPKSPEFQKFLPLVKNFVSDSNAAAQEKGLSAALLFVENAASAVRICGDILGAIVAKCLAAPKPKTRELAQEIVLTYVELEKQEAVVEELGKGLENKNPKIVAASVSMLRQCLHLFGSRVITVKPLFKVIPKLLEDRDKGVREEGKQLAVELYRWIREALRPLLQSLKPIQASELEAEFAKLPADAPKPERLLRSQQAQVEDRPDEVDQVVDTETETAMDPYELVDAVDLLGRLPKDFYEQIEAKKWQDRKEALEKLLELASHPKLESGDYGDLVKALKKAIGKDSNVMVVSLASKCLGLVAGALRQRFHPYASSCVPVLLEKCKEKKPTVLVPVREALDQVAKPLTLEAMLEDITTAMDNKNPQIRSEAVAFMARVLTRTAPAALNKKLLKSLITPLHKTFNDPDPSVRENSAQAMGTAMKVVGEKAFAPFLVDLDSIKMEKVKECFEKAEVVGRTKAKTEPKAEPKTEQKAEPKAEPRAKPRAEPKAEAKVEPKVVAPPKVQKAIKGGKPRKPEEGRKAEAPFVENPMSDEEANAHFPEDVREALVSTNWKDRLAAVDKMKELLGNVPVQATLKILCRKPGLKDTNFQVLKGKLEVVEQVLEHGPVSLCSADCCLGDLVDKVGDVKNGASAGAALSALAQGTSLDHVAREVLQLAFAQKNPKNQSESLLWLAGAIKEFGLSIPVKVVIEHIKKGLSASNPAVRGASITLAGVMYLYMGKTLRMLFEGEKPTLLQQLDSEFAKLEGQSAPVPTRGPKSTEVQPSSGEDLIPRTDIRGELNESLLNDLGDKNWKVRQEALQKLATIVDRAKLITKEIGDLPTALRPRMNDSNKNLAIQALTIGKVLGVALGPSCTVHVRTLAPGMFAALGDSKPAVRGAAIACLKEWCTHVPLGSFFDGDTLKDALKVENPVLRTEVFGWLAEVLSERRQGLEGGDLAALLPILYQCLEERSADVRKKAQDCLLPFMLHLGYESMARATTKLKATSKDNVLTQLDKVRSQLPAKAPPPQGRATIVRGGTPSDSRENLSGDSDTRAPNRPAKAARGPAKGATKTAPKKEEEPEQGGPLLVVNNNKEIRFTYERALKVLKWNFTTPREEFYQQLKEQMVAANWAAPLVANCFHSDFKFHIRAIDMLSESLSQGLEPTTANLDLVLKWLALRFFDTNPSVLLKALEYLQALFGALAEAEYRMYDIEASSFLPYLILKTGDSKDTVRKGVHEILRRVCNVYPASKLFVYLMQGVASKNARQRAECLEEMGQLIASFGTNVCDPAAALKEVAKQISDRDNSVRNAALNCVVQAYFHEGEKVYKQVGHLSDKDMSLLEERIKRASRSRPVISRPAPTSRPQSAVFPSTTAVVEEAVVVHRHTRSGTVTRPLTRPRSIGLELSTDVDNMIREPQRTAQYRNVDVDDILSEPEINLPHRRRRADSRDVSQVLSQLAAQEVPLVMEALLQVEQMLDREEIASRADQLVTMLSLQFRLAHNKHMEDDHVARADVVQLYLRLCALLLKVFSKESSLGRRVGRDVLRDLLPHLLTVLLDGGLCSLRDGARVTHSVNRVTLHVILHAQPTAVMSALIKHLHDCVSTMGSSEKYLDLVLKCLWKMMKNMEMYVNELQLDAVLQDINLFLKAYPASYWEGRPSDTPLRTVKTILYKLSAHKGHELLKQAELVPGKEESHLVEQIQKMLKLHARKSQVNKEKSNKTECRELVDSNKYSGTTLLGATQEEMMAWTSSQWIIQLNAVAEKCGQARTDAWETGPPVSGSDCGDYYERILQEVQQLLMRNDSNI
ncbi:cytoskeleton-associated protein 5-like isoform X2 [Ornithodoros turicata]|uniref:cytoskeleton-associated protein 5-like isoform X2 n=1 Tax=Ornithodoros turicata TaxID=34597 RepID=UPI0031399DF7